MTIPWHQTDPEWSLSQTENTQTLTCPTGILTLYNVRGDAIQQARTYDTTPHPVVQYRANYIQNALANSPHWRMANTINWLTWRKLGAKWMQNTPQRRKEAMAHMSHVGPRPTHNAHNLNEVLAGLNQNKKWRPNIHMPPQPSGGLSVIDTTQENLLVAHRLDDTAGEHWTDASCITCHHPNDGLSTICVSSRGLFGISYQAMNEAGITLSLHPQPNAPIDVHARPLHALVFDILTRTHSAKEVISALNHAHTPCGVIYCICDGDAQQAFVLERQPGHKHMRELSPGHHVIGAAFEHLPLPAIPSVADVVKKQRAVALKEHIQTHPPQNMTDLLQTLAPDDQAPFAPHTPTTANVNLVIFEPARRRIWVSCGGLPASAGWMIPVVLDRTAGRLDQTAQPMIANKHWHKSDLAIVYKKLTQAKQALAKQSPLSALTHIEFALALVPKHPKLTAIGALIALKAGRLKRAEGILRGALNQSEALLPIHRAKLNLYLSWCLDLGNQHLGARHLQNELIDNPYIPLEHQHRHRLKKRITTTDIQRMNLDMIYDEVPIF